MTETINPVLNAVVLARQEAVARPHEKLSLALICYRWARGQKCRECCSRIPYMLGTGIERGAPGQAVFACSTSVSFVWLESSWKKTENK